MSGKRTTAFIGLHQGPYTVGAETRADIPVHAFHPDGERIVIGRFPLTKRMDAAAQATAYANLPELAGCIRAFIMAHGEIGNDPNVNPEELISFVEAWMREAHAVLSRAGIPV